MTRRVKGGGGSHWASTPGIASGPGAGENSSGEVERSVLLDSIRCDVPLSSFLLNTAEGGGDLARERDAGP